MPRRKDGTYKFKMQWTYFDGELVFTYLKQASLSSKVMFRLKNVNNKTSGLLPVLVNPINDVLSNGRFNYNKDQLYSFRFQPNI